MAFEISHPPDESSWGKSRAAIQHNDSVLKLISEKEAVRGGLVGDFYASCMDTASMDRAGLAPVESELRRINEIRTADEVGAEMTRMFGHPRLRLTFYRRSATESPLKSSLRR